MSLNYIADGQMTLFDVGLWSGKTFPAPLAVTTAKISAPSLKKRVASSTKTPVFLRLTTEDGHTQASSWEVLTDQITVSHGDCTTRNFGECPNVAKESRLSQILEEQPLPKYCLSAKACQGVLNRANKRGKELPEMLRTALINQARQ